MDKKEVNKAIKTFQDAVITYYNQIKINNTLNQDSDATKQLLTDITNIRIFLGVFTKELNEKIRMIKRTVKRSKKSSSKGKRSKPKGGNISDDIQSLEQEIKALKQDTTKK